jgi:hypothetical protein
MEERLKYIFTSQETSSYEHAYRLEKLNSEKRNSSITKLFKICPFCAFLYQILPFIAPTKCKMLFNRNIKEAFVTCFGTRVPSSEKNAGF